MYAFPNIKSQILTRGRNDDFWCNKSSKGDIDGSGIQI